MENPAILAEPNETTRAISQWSQITTNGSHKGTERSSHPMFPFRSLLLTRFRRECELKLLRMSLFFCSFRGGGDLRFLFSSFYFRFSEGLSDYSTAHWFGRNVNKSSTARSRSELGEKKRVWVGKIKKKEGRDKDGLGIET